MKKLKLLLGLFMIIAIFLTVYGEKNKKKMFLTLNSIEGKVLTAVYNKEAKKK